ncbi:thiopurine S-methyltransferase [Herbaspirillum sp. WKF16]|jgi:thiopurine S-methyltransferase|uniref:thiopurine S-methyltransferase n=1 Tax=Herbaspirillum sp. WKF16 TaxID=3028312 RepID=UPI0023A98A0C|nr:thiopurine S-methyltransferase [Herbaspirillum sp. WKF16]WDZ95324.1 thiopurine S-methyltransferase [Herbaspirillum sp. WKF16]
MEAEFWLERWREGRTHFHQSRVTPLLQKYWPQLALPAGSLVLAPLCGKSLDMLWLAEQGHRVLGVELSQLAVEQFFAENGLQAQVHESAQGRHFVAGAIEIICGDIFALADETLAACAGAYDRAALIALPPEMRPRYAEQVYGRLPAGAQSLLITLEYAQQRMDGPPFSVMEDEVLRLYAPHTQAEAIDRRDILDKEPKFKERGLERLDSVTYRLRRGA